MFVNQGYSRSLQGLWNTIKLKLLSYNLRHSGILSLSLSASARISFMGPHPQALNMLIHLPGGVHLCCMLLYCHASIDDNRKYCPTSRQLRFSQLCFEAGRKRSGSILLAQRAARSRSSCRSRALRVSDAARSNSARAS